MLAVSTRTASNSRSGNASAERRHELLLRTAPNRLDGLQLTRHSHCTIQPYNLPVQHTVLYRILYRPRKFLRLARPLRELHYALQAFAHFITQHCGHVALKQAGRKRYNPDTKAREIARHGQCHAAYGTLGCGIRDLSHLAIEGCRGGYHYDDAALTIRAVRLILRQVRQNLTDQVDSAPQVYRDDRVEGAEGEGLVLLADYLDGGEK